MQHPRRLEQPGPAGPERLVSAVGRLKVLDFTLAPGLTLNAAVSAPLLAAGFASAQVEISGGALSPFAYVMPADAPDARHVAWYSTTFSPPGETRLERGAVTFGRREGAPFIHCHATWIEPDGKRFGGHILPHEAVVATPIRARAYGCAEVEMTAEFDPETNFTLFTPRVLSAPAEGPRIAIARACPNLDLFAAVEAMCRRHGFAAGRLRGGVGSLIGARFTDAPAVEDYATEVFIRDGRVEPDGAGGLAATLEVALVGLTGVLAEGTLTRGDNPVLVTFELAVEDVPA